MPSHYDMGSRPTDGVALKQLAKWQGSSISNDHFEEGRYLRLPNAENLTTHRVTKNRFHAV